MPSLISTKHEYIELSHTLDEDDEPPDASPSTAPIQQQQLPVEELYSLGPKRSASIHRHSMEALLEEANGLSSRENEESKAPLTTTTTDRKQLVFQFVSYSLLTNLLFFLLSLPIDEILGPILGYEQQSLPSLIVSLVGLVFAGVLMDKYQHWDVFLRTSELFILLPILLNLKGNLEMILAARLSTLANMGDLDNGPVRRSLVVGNLALLQVQALVAGAVAGLASFGLGLLTRPESVGSYYECVYMTASSMVSASFSSAVLGVFMCALILICRRFNVNPDNIACPLASATGDIVTLLILAGCAIVLQRHMHSLLSTLVFLLMFAMVPLFGYIVWTNKHLKDLLFVGWIPIMCAMIISSFAGVLLEQYVDKYKGVALLTPVLIGVAGNLGSIYSSRISTCLHQDSHEHYATVEWVLFLMNIPVQVVFLLIIWGFNMGQLNYNFWFFLTYMLVSLICTFICLKIGKWMTLGMWRMGYDPDNYVIPYLTASIDVLGTILLVAICFLLTVTKANDMSSPGNQQMASTASPPL